MRYLFLQLAGFSAILACLCATQVLAGERPHNDAVTAILKLADNLNAKDAGQTARTIVRDHDGCDISQIFRPRSRGGAGVGSIATTPGANSIDHLVRRWASDKPPTAEQLKKHQTDLLKMARVLQAMAELAPHRMPMYPKGDKRIEEWPKVTHDFKIHTRDLREGIEALDADRVRATAVKLENTCNRCHTIAF